VQASQSCYIDTDAKKRDGKPNLALTKLSVYLPFSHLADALGVLAVSSQTFTGVVEHIRGAVFVCSGMKARRL
jgi:hypothetical protein